MSSRADEGAPRSLHPTDEPTPHELTAESDVEIWLDEGIDESHESAREEIVDVGEERKPDIMGMVPVTIASNTSANVSPWDTINTSKVDTYVKVDVWNNASNSNASKENPIFPRLGNEKVDCVFGAWGDWSACTKSCGGGQ